MELQRMLRGLEDVADLEGGAGGTELSPFALPSVARILCAALHMAAASGHPSSTIARHTATARRCTRQDGREDGGCVAAGCTDGEGTAVESRRCVSEASGVPTHGGSNEPAEVACNVCNVCNVCNEAAEVASPVTDDNRCNRCNSEAAEFADGGEASGASSDSGELVAAEEVVEAERDFGGVGSAGGEEREEATAAVQVLYAKARALFAWDGCELDASGPPRCAAAAGAAPFEHAPHAAHATHGLKAFPREMATHGSAVLRPVRVAPPASAAPPPSADAPARRSSWHDAPTDLASSAGGALVAEACLKAFMKDESVSSGTVVFVTPEVGAWCTVGGLGVMVRHLSDAFAECRIPTITIAPRLRLVRRPAELRHARRLVGRAVGRPATRRHRVVRPG